MIIGKFQRKSIERTKQVWAVIFLIVPIVFYAGIRFLPTFQAFLLSFTDWDIISRDKNFIGLENYRLILKDKVFWKTLGNTGKYIVFGLPISLLLGFILAYSINKVKGRKMQDLFKAVYFIPYITSMVAIAWVFRWLLQPAPIGVFNNILIALGLPSQQFLFSLKQALPSILTTTIWQGLGFQMIIFLAGLKAIPSSYYEAAVVDGANDRKQLMYITLPLLKPTIVFLVVTGTIRFLRIFTEVLNMSYQGEGGPLNSTKPLVLYIYNKAFYEFEMGYASALTVILFLIILSVTIIQLRVMKDEKE